MASLAYATPFQPFNYNEDTRMTEMAPATNEKLDFTEDGIKPTEKLWTVTRSEVVAVADNPANLEWQVDLTADDEPFARTERFWLKHEDVAGKDWATAVQIGRNNAKKFTRAVTGGSPTISTEEAVGKRLLATIREDGKGYIRVDRFKAAPAEEGIS